MPPKVLTKNGDRGVLPVSSTTRAAAKAPAPRLKLEIRRLPPSLTLSEFEEVMGDEWKLGNGKVDWREYRQGKVKQGLGKVAEQSRCYLHVVNEALVKELEARFLAVTFHDSAGTHKNPDLRHLPPTMGFAMMQRIPTSSKIRADNRQGTIDTDAEFIAFLEAETQPIAKPAALDSVNVDKDSTEKVKVKTTPLIDALREKKANKAKAAAKDDKKDVKGHARKESKEAVVLVKDGKGGKAQQQKVEQASKEAAKAVNKQIASKQQPQQRAASPQQPAAKGPAATSKAKKTGQNAKVQNATPPQATPPAAPAATTAAQSPAPHRQRQRGNNAEGIKKMLQKDLGIKPKPTPAGQKGQAAGGRPGTPATTNGKDKDKPSPAASTAAVNPPKVPTGPKQQHQQQQAPSNSASHSSSQVSTTKAYLKHANPSQGMTEILIQQVLSQYGDVANVTIDPRKGTAIAIFKSNDGLKKALEAKKVPVANGSIEMLEFKDRSGGSNAGAGGGGGGGGRGGFRGGRGGGRGARNGGNPGGGQAASGSAKPVAKAEAGS